MKKQSGEQKKDIRITITLDADTEKTLRKYCYDNRISMSEYIRNLINKS